MIREVRHNKIENFSLFDKLPSELLIKISKYLSLNDKISIANTCENFCNVEGIFIFQNEKEVNDVLDLLNKKDTILRIKALDFSKIKKIDWQLIKKIIKHFPQLEVIKVNNKAQFPLKYKDNELYKKRWKSLKKIVIADEKKCYDISQQQKKNYF
ncbi:MAG: hypothetical protein HRK26_02985 [Rickettsiaceae bacterium H1]|nr:hypothetical protein [Rickettsiaceae bacterium H1]